MFWVVQENLAQEIGHIRLVEALRQRRLPFVVVQVVPFSHDLIPEPSPPPGPVLVSGSTALSLTALERGWQPGALLNGNFDFAVWGREYRPWLLNAEAVMAPFGRLEIREPMFLRPCSDLKTFAGLVITPAALAEWQQQVQAIADDFATLTPETLVLAAPLKEIQAEYRFFVVAGQVVTGSQYKLGNRVRTAPGCHPAALELAQTAARHWSPACAFVLDVALTETGPFILEINCLTSAGFYEAEVGRLVDALEGRFG